MISRRLLKYLGVCSPVQILIMYGRMVEFVRKYTTTCFKNPYRSTENMYTVELEMEISNNSSHYPGAMLGLSSFLKKII